MKKSAQSGAEAQSSGSGGLPRTSGVLPQANLIFSASCPFSSVRLRSLLDGAARSSGSTPVLGRLGKRWPSFVGRALLSGCLCCLTVRILAQSTYSEAYTFSTLAGYSGSGSADGAGDNARFYRPSGATADGAGNIYVADTANHTVRKITPAGVVTTLAGLAGAGGSADGTAGTALFNSPKGVAADSAGNVYVADTSNHTIRRITVAGVVSTIAGLAGFFGTNDGTGSAARFSNPSGLAVDSAGNVYVADTDNHTIRKVTPAGSVSTLAGQAGWYGSADGTGGNARFYGPWGVAVDGTTNVYVADTQNFTIRKITVAGVVSTLAGLPNSPGGTNDGAGSAARFYLPRGLALDGATNIYVADYGGATIRKITPSGIVSTLAGLGWTHGSVDGTGSNARFNWPSGVAVDSVGNVSVADERDNMIRKITSAGVVSTLAGLAGSVGSADGTGDHARFSSPVGVAVDSVGNVYAADYWIHTIRKITSAGVVSTLAGLAGFAGTNDGTGSNARFNGPLGVAVDSAGTVYVADYDSHTIRKVTPAGVVSTLAGRAGYNGTNDGIGSNARFYYPEGVAVDSTGIVYVGDTINHTIRKITPSGIVSTLAGLARNPGSADGVGSNAQFNRPSLLATDSGGHVYVADMMNQTIRKITPSGIVSTLAGLVGSYGSADGTGSDARFNWPMAVAVDSADHVYVADALNYTIRKITPSGMVRTLAGLAGSEGSDDGTGSAARFNHPEGVAVDSAGNVYVADTGNNTIRKGVFQQHMPTNVVPYTPPAMNGQLVVTLLPPEASGQWRFPWEFGWHSSGEGVSNLMAGNYPIEFRDVPGYLAFPPTVTAALSCGVITEVTNQYYPTFDLSGTTNTGVLAVNIGPTAPSGAGWRFLGETTWRTPGSAAADLLPGTYFIEFVPVSGYSKPASQAVQVSAGAMTAIWASYLLAQSAPPGVRLPVPVPAASISDLTNYPFGFNGQLQSDVGYGSGVAVLTNVVLTAAHLVFNDQTLTYVSQVYWRFRQEAGVIFPKPQAARGWYILGGYAVQRTNDVLGGLGPGRSSPQSRNLDVAALYFEEPVAGGGYGGCLPSDTVPNLWLKSVSQKMLVGYPVDGSSLGDASIVPGVMYQVGPQPYPLSLASDLIANQQVYVAPWMLSYPGNSGGPFYVQFNGYFYPAGVYLGTLYNGVVPYASLVRGIDSNVVNMITWAQELGDSGTNSTGGGVITIRAGSGGGLLAYLQVNIGPQAALDAGGAWRVQGTAAWSGGPTYTAAIAAGDSVTLEFKPVAGWNLPASSTVQITMGQLTVVPATYTPNAGRLAVSPASGLTATGFAGGPFSPSSALYTLTNLGGTSLSWSASKTANWLSLSLSNGTLAAAASTNIAVSLNSLANSLAPGSYSGTFYFTNLTTGLGSTNFPASLSVAIHPSVVLINPLILTNGNIAMTLEGVTNGVYSILGATNLLQPLTNWTELRRLTNTAGRTSFTNPPPVALPQFYRAREL
jgi:hypothetical protein